MKPDRPEIGARLDHLCVRSGDPHALAAFFERVFEMPKTAAVDIWRCSAAEREILIAPGPPNTTGFIAFAFDDDAALDHYRSVLVTRVALQPNPSIQFADSAFSVADPDGNVVAFGMRTRSGPSADFPGRLQHIGLRTPRIEEMAAFYERVLSFVVSDRVLDDQGVLRACFLRSDAEHHTVALFAAPDARLDHHSYETRDWQHIRLWADRMGQQRIPIFWGVGRHGPGNDVFFMVKDADGNLVEISAELEYCAADRLTGLWPHEEHTLNLWGSAIMRS